MISPQATALFFMFVIAICILFPTLIHWYEASKKVKIAAFVFSAIFGLPPLIAIWVTGVFG